MAEKYKFDQRAYNAQWAPYRYHAQHAALWKSDAIFNVTGAGRRSGKSGLHKRLIILGTLAATRHRHRTVVTAPTRPHVKDLYWRDLKEMLPRGSVQSVSESELKIYLRNGASIELYGLEKAQRIEGSPIDLFFGDEWADVKPMVLEAHVLPALGTTGRQGRAYLYGVPEGRNHFYSAWKKGKDGKPGWSSFWWPSWEVLLPEEMAIYQEAMSADVYEREWGASFDNYDSNFYSAFDEDLHTDNEIVYDPLVELNVCLDFNNSPGVALLTQEQHYEGNDPLIGDSQGRLTCAIDEVYKAKGSNTRKICQEIIRRYGSNGSRVPGGKAHSGYVTAYGDATGGAEKTNSDQSDWDIVDEMLGAAFPRYRRISGKGKYKANPSVRARGNSVNARFLNTLGCRRFAIAAARCPETVRDLLGVPRLADGNMDKKAAEAAGLSHLSDALGYYIHTKFPLGGKVNSGRVLLGS